MSETALITARKARLDLAAKKGSLGAKAALALTSTPNRFLSTSQIGITLVSIIIGAVGGEEYAHKIAVYIEPIPYIGQYAIYIAKALNFVIIGYVTIAFGEMIPTFLNNYTFMFITVAAVALGAPDPNPLLWLVIALVGGGALIAATLGALRLVGGTTQTD